jgi:hypothetical protein
MVAILQMKPSWFSWKKIGEAVFYVAFASGCIFLLNLMSDKKPSADEFYSVMPFANLLSFYVSLLPLAILGIWKSDLAQEIWDKIIKFTWRKKQLTTPSNKQSASLLRSKILSTFIFLIISCWCVSAITSIYYDGGNKPGLQGFVITFFSLFLLLLIILIIKEWKPSKTINNKT